VVEPLAVGLIPLDCSADSFLKANLGLPTHFCADIGTIQSISTIMSRSIPHNLNRRFPLPEVMIVLGYTGNHNSQPGRPHNASVGTDIAHNDFSRISFVRIYLLTKFQLPTDRSSERIRYAIVVRFSFTGTSIGGRHKSRCVPNGLAPNR
jgi:hypothetical protein